MPELVIGMWFMNYVRHAVGNVSEMANALSLKIDAAFAGHGDNDFYIFLVPEFYFTKNELNDSRPRWLSPAEKQEAINKVNTLSLRRTNFLLVGGSICSYRTEQRSGKDHYLITNAAPVAYKGAACARYHKTKWGGETSNADARILYKLTKGTLDLRVVREKRRTILCCIPVKTTEVVTVVDPSTVPGGLWSVGADTVGGKKATAKMEPRIHYESGTGSGAFQVPGIDATFGIEICMEHECQVLKKAVGGDGLDFHLLVSNSVAYHADSVHLREGGYFLYCDTQTYTGKKNLVMHKSGGELVDKTGVNRVDVEKDLFVWTFPLTHT